MTKRSSDATDLRIASFDGEPSLAVGAFFNGFTASSESSFSLYKAKKSDGYFLHGENQQLVYEGKTDEDDNSRYYLAVYDRSKKAVDVYAAPLVGAKVSTKRHKVYNGPSIRHNDLLNMVKRNALGQEFGTKKAKKAIADVSANRIEAEKLQHHEADIVDTVQAATETLLTTQEMNQGVTDDRPTPRCVADATNVEDIYPISSLVPKKEWPFIKVSLLLGETDTAKRLEFFPYKSSKYVELRLARLTSFKQEDKLKLLYYASLLFGVYANRRVHNKLALLEKLDSPSEILIDGILSRFTTYKSGLYGKSKDKNFTIDPYHEDKLLCYLLAVILTVDNFQVAVPPLAQELSMKPSRLTLLFKALGCSVKPATATQAEAFGIPRNLASTYKVASLKVPFKEPVMVRRGRK